MEAEVAFRRTIQVENITLKKELLETKKQLEISQQISQSVVTKIVTNNSNNDNNETSIFSIKDDPLYQISDISSVSN